MKSLVVDDLAINRRVLTGILSRHGEAVAVDGARNAIQSFQEAWKEEKPFDLICVDIMMPEIDGQQTLELLRKMEGKMGIDNEKCARIVMVTAKDDSESIKKSRELGCDGYLTKPIDLNALSNCLRKLALIE
jgi:two-component system chemotaxis response regulator CheY